MYLEQRRTQNEWLIIKQVTDNVENGTGAMTWNRSLKKGQISTKILKSISNYELR